MGPVPAHTITTGIMGFDTVLRNVVPALTFEASDWFPSAFVYAAFFVADVKAFCYGSVCHVDVVECEEEMGCSLVIGSVCYCFCPGSQGDSWW